MLHQKWFRLCLFLVLCTDEKHECRRVQFSEGPPVETLSVEVKMINLIFEIQEQKYYVPRLCIKTALSAKIYDWSKQVSRKIWLHLFFRFGGVDFTLCRFVATPNIYAQNFRLISLELYLLLSRSLKLNLIFYFFYFYVLPQSKIKLCCPSIVWIEDCNLTIGLTHTCHCKTTNSTVSSGRGYQLNDNDE